MHKKITLIPGDGIGPEVTAQAVKALDAVAGRFGHVFIFKKALMGAVAIDETGDPLPAATIEACLESDAILFGAIGHPKYDNDPAAKIRPEQGLLKLRKTLQLFANIRPVTIYPSLVHLSPLKTERLKNVDLLIFRELTGGIYFGKKSISDDGLTASDDCIYSRFEIERIARPAFEAAQNRRKKLTLVDKANVLETSRLWRKVVQEIAADYPGVALDFLFVDNAAMQIIVNPAQFDVILTENMFGDILSDEASVLSGSLGLLPSASLAAPPLRGGRGGLGLFEPIHGSYPQAAGKDIANPLGSILSAAMMLDYFDMKKEANLMRGAVDWSLENGLFTADLDPKNGLPTSTVGELIAQFIENDGPPNGKMHDVRMVGATII